MAESEPHDTRRPYVAPRVDDLGTLEELTHGSTGPVSDGTGVGPTTTAAGSF